MEKVNKTSTNTGWVFSVKNSLMPIVECPVATSEHIISLNISTTGGFAIITGTDDVHQFLWFPLSLKRNNCSISNSAAASLTLPLTELYPLGNLNAKVSLDHDMWLLCTGHSEVGKTKRMTTGKDKWTLHRGLWITDTYFQDSHHQKVLWRHLKSGHWHQLYLIVIHRKYLQDVLHTGHALVCCKIRFSLQKLHHTKIVPHALTSTT